MTAPKTAVEAVASDLVERLLGGPNSDALFVRRVRNEAAAAVTSLQTRLTEAEREREALSAEHDAANREIVYLRRARETEAEDQLHQLRLTKHPSHCKVWAVRDGGGNWPCSCGLVDRIKDAEAHIRGITTAPNWQAAPKHGWTCFHCGETFVTVEGARKHFGDTFDNRPVCEALAARVAVLEGALVEAEAFIDRISGGGETDFRAKLRSVLGEKTDG
jgi:hypothetical protein